MSRLKRMRSSYDTYTVRVTHRRKKDRSHQYCESSRSSLSELIDCINHTMYASHLH